MSDVSILNTLIDAMDETLNTVLIDLVFDVDTQAGLVRPGKLQDDPTDAGTNILIHRGNETWMDELNVNNPAIDAPTYEIGGTEWWWRRFIIQKNLFFDNENERSIARNKANVIDARLQQALRRMEIPDEEDDFGEVALFLQVCKSYLREGGGEGTFIWNGETYVEFLTVVRR